VTPPVDFRLADWLLKGDARSTSNAESAKVVRFLKLRRRSVAQQLKLDAIFKVLEGRGAKATACRTFGLKLVI
jgi:hypothetical protein